MVVSVKRFGDCRDLPGIGAAGENCDQIAVVTTFNHAHIMLSAVERITGLVGDRRATW